MSTRQALLSVAFFAQRVPDEILAGWKYLEGLVFGKESACDMAATFIAGRGLRAGTKPCAPHAMARSKRR